MATAKTGGRGTHLRPEECARFIAAPLTGPGGGSAPPWEAAGGIVSALSRVGRCDERSSDSTADSVTEPRRIMKRVDQNVDLVLVYTTRLSTPRVITRRSHAFSGLKSSGVDSNITVPSQ
jgi:hypothetical protein